MPPRHRRRDAVPRGSLHAREQRRHEILLRGGSGRRGGGGALGAGPTRGRTASSLAKRRRLSGQVHERRRRVPGLPRSRGRRRERRERDPGSERPLVDEEELRGHRPIQSRARRAHLRGVALGAVARLGPVALASLVEASAPQRPVRPHVDEEPFVLTETRFVHQPERRPRRKDFPSNVDELEPRELAGVVTAVERRPREQVRVLRVLAQARHRVGADPRVGERRLERREPRRAPFPVARVAQPPLRVVRVVQGKVVPLHLAFELAELLPHRLALAPEVVLGRSHLGLPERTRVKKAVAAATRRLVRARERLRPQHLRVRREERRGAPGDEPGERRGRRCRRRRADRVVGERVGGGERRRRRRLREPFFFVVSRRPAAAAFPLAHPPVEGDVGGQRHGEKPRGGVPGLLAEHVRRAPRHRAGIRGGIERFRAGPAAPLARLRERAHRVARRRLLRLAQTRRAAVLADLGERDVREGEEGARGAHSLGRDSTRSRQKLLTSAGGLPGFRSSDEPFGRGSRPRPRPPPPPPARASLGESRASAGPRAATPRRRPRRRPSPPESARLAPSAAARGSAREARP